MARGFVSPFRPRGLIDLDSSFEFEFEEGFSHGLGCHERGNHSDFRRMSRYADNQDMPLLEVDESNLKPSWRKETIRVV